jgi:hypothetical protein
MYKKILLVLLTIITISINLVIMSEFNFKEDLNIDSLIKLTTANAQNEIGEITVKPGQFTQTCFYICGYSVGGSVGFPAGVSVTYSVNYCKGTEDRCTESGNGCKFRACS